MLIRNDHNPLILPEAKNKWESYATFNGSVLRENGVTHVVYRALSDMQKIGSYETRISTVGYTQSKDGVHFEERKQLIKPEYEWEQYGCEDPRITKIDDEYFIFYTALSRYPFCAEGIKIAVAVTNDLTSITEKHLVTPFNAKAMTLFPKKINGKYVALLTVHTDSPPTFIAIAEFEKKEDMWSREYWDKWHDSLESHILPLRKTTLDQIEVGATPIETNDGWLFIYSYIKDYYIGKPIFGIEAAWLDTDTPQTIHARTSEFLLTPEKEYETKGLIPNIVFPSGAYIEDKTLHVWYGASDTSCCSASMNVSDLRAMQQEDQIQVVRVERCKTNPILEPRIGHSWEAKQVFNPAAITLNDSIHLIYRGMSFDNTSVFGYAESKDGIHFDRFEDPVYVPRKEFELKKNPGGNSGCEDPRLTRIGDTIYMCYTAYNGIESPRVALTHISEKDFKEKKWNFSEPILISPPRIDDKDACILEEKMKNKYVVFHRIEPNITIDLVDSLEFGEDRWLGSQIYITPQSGSWDDLKIGINAPPIKTQDGWLLLYHGICKKDKAYRLGAMLLDLDTPTKVVARGKYPILEPEYHYEKEGIVPNVVFPCGAVVKDNTLHIYYGGADTFLCLGTISLQRLLSFIKQYPQ